MKKENQIKLKVCGMKFQDNLEGLVALQPDFIGFIFYPKSPRYIVGSLGAEIMKTIPETITKVGVFVNEEMEKVLGLAKGYGLDMVQLHGDETPEYCELVRMKVKVLKAFAMSDDFDFTVLEAYEDHVDYFLFDTKTPKYGGSGLKFNWELLKRYNSIKPFFLSGGVDVEEIDEILKLNIPQLFAIDMNSKIEVEPGLKDLELVKEVKRRMGV